MKKKMNSVYELLQQILDATPEHDMKKVLSDSNAQLVETMKDGKRPWDNRACEK